jgi:hypothetical protein
MGTKLATHVGFPSTQLIERTGTTGIHPPALAGDDFWFGPGNTSSPQVGRSKADRRELRCAHVRNVEVRCSGEGASVVISRRLTTSHGHLRIPVAMPTRGR